MGSVRISDSLSTCHTEVEIQVLRNPEESGYGWMWDQGLVNDLEDL